MPEIRGFSCEKEVNSMIIGGSTRQELHNPGNNTNPLNEACQTLEVRRKNSNLFEENELDNKELIGL